MERVTRGLVPGEDGYRLWLRYAPIVHPARRAEYTALLEYVLLPGDSTTLEAARQELQLAAREMLSIDPTFVAETPSTKTGAEGSAQRALWVGTPSSNSSLRQLDLKQLRALGEEGYCVVRREVAGDVKLLIAANTDRGVLYGVFAFLRFLVSERPLSEIGFAHKPKVKLRLLNHWDNLDGTIERGYAGSSLWDWFRLPAYESPRYVDYARANASIGINGTVLTNVNANALVLSEQYQEKVRALADVFRRYGIRVYLTARFSAPIELGLLETADPREPRVQEFWNTLAQQLYSRIPDFGGLVVKANSEGQPGPQDYDRSHAEGANLLARALAPFGGVVVWRAFVYSSEIPEDRATQAYTEFVPLDGKFLDNVLVQVKNGPIDFQPREPFHPLFGAMPKTKLMLEFQITQEYLGNSTHLAYLAPLFSETLHADTHCRGAGSRVAYVIDGSLDGHSLTGIAGVSNVGSDANWCGHPFAAANWYAFGRLAWDPELGSEAIAREWLAMTFSRDPAFLDTATRLMMLSREAVVDYMTPLGLHHIMAKNHHQGPGPWVNEGRPDWTSTYYHRADPRGLGFDRTERGSNALSQYRSPYRESLADPERCPLELLLWFHHVPWNQPLRTGNTLWKELCLRYQRGVARVREMQRLWQELETFVDPARFLEVDALLRVQERDARWWKDACLSYFQTFSRLPFPEEIEAPEASLADYQSREQYYVPGIPERRFP